MTKRRALITMVHDEAFFLPIWLGYYSRYFEPADIYVLDHDTTDGSTDREGFVRIPVSHDAVDHTWMVETIQALQHKLFEEYDVVVVTDVDEIIVPNPVFTNLGEYLDEFDQEFVNCHGFELVHMRDREPPYVPGVPILDQRSYWFENALYSKPAIATKPTVWLPGFHFREDRRTNDD